MGFVLLILSSFVIRPHAVFQKAADRDEVKSYCYFRHQRVTSKLAPIGLKISLVFD